MSSQTNKSVIAIVPEVTEGTPVAPSAATNYIAVEEGFGISPQTDVLESAELTGSIGTAAPILSFENPPTTLPHYLKHSGTEGVAPEIGNLCEATFGAKSVNATQYDTVASSTVAIIKVDTGEGANFERGEALLIKDATNGYHIRPVLSISSDDLTLGFQLPTGMAPAVSTNLGKAILYKPGESHPTMAVWDYHANGLAVQMSSGNRVSEMTVSAPAGDFLNASWSLQGIAFYFNPIEITSSTRYLDFLDNATTRAAVVATGFYKDPVKLAEALAASMNALGSANTFTVTYSSSTGKFTITSNGTTLTLKWNTGANTANSIATKVGFTTAADSSAALTYTSANAQTLTSPYTPSYDAIDPMAVKDHEVLLGDSTTLNPSCFSTASMNFTITNTIEPISAVCAESGRSGSVITKRLVTVDVVSNPTPYSSVDQYKRYRAGDSTAFLYNFGIKSGGNWVAGKSGCIYMPTAKFSSFEIADQNGLAVLNFTLQAFVSGGLGEVYLNFL